MLVCGVVLACAVGCSSGDSSGPQADSPEPTQEPDTEELFVGECGSMSDQDVASIAGIPDLIAASKNGIRCRWESATSAYAMFTWYRGSPIDRESSVAAAIGRDVRTIDVEGHPGFTAKGSDLSCEAGIESGDGFLHWSINYSLTTPPRDSCLVVEDLARATVAKAK